MTYLVHSHIDHLVLHEDALKPGWQNGVVRKGLHASHIEGRAWLQRWWVVMVPDRSPLQGHYLQLQNVSIEFQDSQWTILCVSDVYRNIPRFQRAAQEWEGGAG